MATKKKASKKAPKKKAAKKTAKKPAKKAATKTAKKAAKKTAPAPRQSLDRQLEEIRVALDDLAQEFETFRAGVTRSSRALLSGVAGFRQALSGMNPLNPASLRQAAARLTEGVQRFVRAIQDR